MRGSERNILGERVILFHDQPASVAAFKSISGVTAHAPEFGHMEIKWPPAARIDLPLQFEVRLSACDTKLLPRVDF